MRVPTIDVAGVGSGDDRARGIGAAVAREMHARGYRLAPLP